MNPYWSDGTCSLYLGDCREVLPALGIVADCVIADPPYAQTSLAWDRWPDGWLAAVAAVSSSMWCFGSLRMYMQRAPEFARDRWKLSQDIIWAKHNGSGFHADRFKRVHEQPSHWYRGPWGAIYHDVPTTPDPTARTVRHKKRPPHMGKTGVGVYVSQDGGPRLMRSVLHIRSMHGRAIHPTEKPVPLIIPMITYSCPPGGLVVDPFAGSGSTLAAARQLNRPAIGIESNESSCERAAARLAREAAAS